mmetsp:Transcript_10141/g.18286  ORF Transcript_10141/g.18286 Transcript_10141/m.18286 type:complete len:221 (-) Transcript_10141:497-1159(-)
MRKMKRSSVLLSPGTLVTITRSFRLFPSQQITCSSRVPFCSSFTMPVNLSLCSFQWSSQNASDFINSSMKRPACFTAAACTASFDSCSFTICTRREQAFTAPALRCASASTFDGSARVRPRCSAKASATIPSHSRPSSSCNTRYQTGSVALLRLGCDSSARRAPAPRPLSTCIKCSVVSSSTVSTGLSAKRTCKATTSAICMLRPFQPAPAEKSPGDMGQ